MAGFVFATCAPRMERFLKAEVRARLPSWRLAFSRPGLVTWRLDGGINEDIAIGAAFARVWGKSLGRADDAAQAVALIEAALPAGGEARLHVFAREPEGGGEAAAVEAALRERLGGAIAGAATAEIGDLVFDVIVAPGEPMMVGVHRHQRWRGPHPGGVAAAELPAAAPSRAYTKIVEAIAWSGLPVKAGDVALEIGCAPGGAALALVERGVTVWGVDTGELAANVAEARGPGGARCHHLRTKVGGLRWEDLPPHIDWLLVDVNLAPQVAIHSVARLMPKLAPTVRGAVFTLKMNEEAFVEALPVLLDRLRALGFAEVHATHLPSNRQEVCAVGLRAGER